MKKGFLILAALAFFIAVVAKYAEVHSLTHRPLTVGFVHMKENMATPWHRENIASIKAVLAQSDINTIFYGGKSCEEQIRAVRYCARQKVDAIVVMPIEPLGWDHALNECRAGGIPVITIERGINTADHSLITTKIKSDADKEGQELFELMDDFVKAAAPPKKDGQNYNIAILLGIPWVEATEGRRNGFLDAMLASPDITDYNIIGEEYGYFSRDKGYDAAKKILAGTKGKADIICAQNDDMALGAVDAVTEAGMSPGKDIMIFSVDGLAEVERATAEGKINGFVKNSPDYGAAVKQALDDILQGQGALLAKGAEGRVYAVETMR